MSDILDEAQEIIQCKACPWYKNCVMPMRLNEADLKRQLESSMPGIAPLGATEHGLPQLFSGLAAAAENTFLEGCPIFIGRLRTNPKLAEQVKKLMQQWSSESEE